MWGGAGVTMERHLSNGKVPWGPGQTPTLIDIQRIGILRELIMLTDGTAAFTAGASLVLDAAGPVNVYKLLQVTPNQQAPIIRMSGIGAYLASFMLAAGEADRFADDVVITGNIHADGVSDVWSANRVTTNGDWRLYHRLRNSQFISSLGTEVGLWPLENPAVQLQLEYTPSSPSAVSPFELDTQNNTTAIPGFLPYYGDPTSNVTLTTPTIDVRRHLYEVPASAADDPPYTYVVTWTEESPQGGNVNGTSFAEWKAVPLSGVLLRLGAFIWDGGASVPAGAGVLETSLTASNAITLLFGADTAKFNHTGMSAHREFAEYYGITPPQGFFPFDFLGKDLTLRDVIDTYTTPEVRLDMNFSTALGAANSYIKILKQMLVPIELTGR